MSSSSYSAINNNRKKLSHPSLIRWIKEEKKNSSSTQKKQNQQRTSYPPEQQQLLDDEDDICRKCFPDGIINDTTTTTAQQQQEDNNRKVRFNECKKPEDSKQALSELTNSETVNAKTELHKKVIFMHHLQNNNRKNVSDKAEQTTCEDEQQQYGKLSDENLFGQVHYLLSSIRSNRISESASATTPTTTTTTKITNMTLLDDDEPRPSNLNVSPSSLFCPAVPSIYEEDPVQADYRTTTITNNSRLQDDVMPPLDTNYDNTFNFPIFSKPTTTLSNNFTSNGLTLADASRQIQSMYNHITSVYGAEPLTQRQIIFEKPLNSGGGNMSESESEHHDNNWRFFKEREKDLLARRLQEISRNLEFEKSQLMKNPKIGELKKRVNELKRKIEREYEKDELFRKQRLKETNRLKLVKNTPKAEEKLKMFLNALNANYSNTCYQVTIYEGEITTCLSKLFLLYLRIEAQLQKSRDNLLSKLSDERLELTARNSLYAFKSFTKKRQDLRQLHQKFDNFISHRRKKSLFNQWKINTRETISFNEKQELAMIHYYNNLQRKAFNSMAFVLNSMILKRCGKELSFMWRDRQLVGKGFFGWRHQSEKTKYLKEGLLKFAVSDSFDELDRFKSEYEMESYMSYKIRLNFRTKITKQLLQIYREKKSLVSLFQNTPKLRYTAELNSHKTIDLSTIYKIEQDDQQCRNFNTLKRPSDQSRRLNSFCDEEMDDSHDDEVGPLYSNFIYQKFTSIPSLTEQVYDIRLKKKLFQTWRERAFDKILTNRANQFHNNITRRKVLLILKENRDQIYDKSLQIQETIDANTIVKFFNKWRATTELVIHEKETIASEYKNITLARKAFDTLKTTCLVDYNPHLNNLCEQWLVKSKERYFKRWKLMLFLRRSEEKFEQAVSEQYNMSLKFKLLTFWKEKTKQRQLLRKVFTDAANRMKSKTTVLENKKSLAKYVLKHLKKNKDVKKTRKHQYFMFIKSKKFYEDNVKQKFFQLWKIKHAIVDEQKKMELTEEEQQKTVIALDHYNQVMMRKVLKSWREYTVESNFVDIFVLRKAFENWRMFTIKSTEEPKYEFKKIIFNRWRTALQKKNELTYSNSIAERFHDRKLAQKSMASIKEYIVQKRIEHVQMIRAKQYHKESLARKVLIELVMNVNSKKEKRRKREKADLFYHKKLIQSSLHSPLSLDRFLSARPNSPFFFSKTVNVVYYKLLIKGIDSLKLFVQKEKLKRLMLAKAVHANASNLVSKFFNLWRIKSNLQSHKYPKFITSNNNNGHKQRSIHSAATATATTTNYSPPSLISTSYGGSGNTINSNNNTKQSLFPSPILPADSKKILIHHHHYLIATDSDDDDDIVEDLYMNIGV